MEIYFRVEQPEIAIIHDKMLFRVGPQLHRSDRIAGGLTARQHSGRARKGKSRNSHFDEKRLFRVDLTRNSHFG